MGRLRPNPEDARENTPSRVKELVAECCNFDRSKRPLFVAVRFSLTNLY